MNPYGKIIHVIINLYPFSLGTVPIKINFHHKGNATDGNELGILHLNLHFPMIAHRHNPDKG